MQSWNHFPLLEREGVGCCLTNEDSTIEFSIAAKFLTKRALSVEVLAQTFNPLWRAQNGFKIQNIGYHRILFTFDNKDDVDRILSSEPWSFDKHLVVMHRYDRDMSIQDLKFENIQTKVTSAIQLVTPVIIGELNVVDSVVNGGITSQAAFETQLKEIDEELIRLTNSGLNQLKFFSPQPCAKVNESINLDAKPLSEPRDQKIPTKVSKHPTQL